MILLCREQKAPENALFDHVIESAKIGLRKPDPRIYRMMADALGVDPRGFVYSTISAST